MPGLVNNLIPQNFILVTLANVHNQVPDKHKSSSNSAIYVPKPETEKYGVPCFISELGSKVEKVIPIEKKLQFFKNTYIGLEIIEECFENGISFI